MVVIGSGLAGLVAAARAVSAGASVGVIARSSGNLNLWSGLAGRDRRPRSREAREAIRFFLDYTAAAGLPYVEAPDSGLLTLVSPSGLPVRACLAPATMAAASGTAGLLVVGFSELPDYQAGLIAAALKQSTGLPVEHRSLSLGSGAASGLAARVAGLFDDRDWRQGFVESARRVLGPDAAGVRAVGFPPVLGLMRFAENVAALQDALGRPVFELPAVPPSVPGQRLVRLWRHRLEATGKVEFYGGRRVARSHVQGDSCLAVQDDLHRYEARAFVLATGGVAGGGLEVPPQAFFTQAGLNGRTEALPGAPPDALPVEPVFGAAVAGRGLDWASWGVRANRDGRPYVGTSRRPLANVFVAGWQLGDPEGTLGANGPDALLSIETGWRAGGLAATRSVAGARGGTP